MEQSAEKRLSIRATSQVLTKLQTEETTNDEQISNDLTGILPIRKVINQGWDAWHLPGHKPKGETCGQYFWNGCLETSKHMSYQVLKDGVYKPHGAFHGKAEVVKHRRTCKQASCEECYPAWGAREGHRALRRIKQYHTKLKPIHVIISPSVSDMNTMDFKSLRQRMYLIAKKVGIQGGMSIIHSHRSICIYCHKDKENCHCKDRKLEWYLSPHFHLIALGWINYQMVAENHAENGWIVKNLGVRERTDKSGKKVSTVAGTITYQLSHAGVNYAEENQPYEKDGELRKDGKLSTISWFGCLSTQTLKIDKADIDERERCTICEGKYYEVIPPHGFNSELAELDKKYYVDRGKWSYLAESKK